MYKSFKKLPLIVQVLLLLIPGVSFFTELFVRLDLYSTKKTTGALIMFILGILTAGLIGFIDTIFVLINGDILQLDK